MLNTITQQTGLQLEYISEEFSKGISINVVHYKLKDANNRFYKLFLSFEELDLPKDYIGCGPFGKLFWYLYEQNKAPKKVTTSYKYKQTVLETLSEEHTKHIDYSLNRYDLIYNSQNYCARIIANNREDFLPIHIDGEKATVGVWLNPVPREGFLGAVQVIFKHFTNLKQIEYLNLVYCPLLDHGWMHYDGYVPLYAECGVKIDDRTSKNNRYNMRREVRLAQEAFGSINIENVPFSELTKEDIDRFYEMKYATHKITREQYDITKKPITDAYVLRTGDGIMRAIFLSSEQDKKIYGETTAYDSTLKKFSFGKMIYHNYLNMAEQKGLLGVAMGGSRLDYKMHYGSVWAIVRSGEIPRKSVGIYNLLRLFGQQNNSDLLHKLCSKINRREE